MLEQGTKAPSFTLANQDGKQICLDDLRGKWVILYFYPKDNTSGCTTEAIGFTNAKADFERLNAVIIGVSPDSPKSHTNFCTKHNLDITLLSDTDHKVLESYGAWQLKKNYGREYFGVVRSTVIIDPCGNVAFMWNKVRVAGHVDTVKDKLTELQNNE